MGQNSCFEKFKNAILENLLNFNEKDEHCDLEVHCSDGVVLVHGLVFAALCPPIKRYFKFIQRGKLLFLSTYMGGSMVIMYSGY